MTLAPHRPSFVRRASRAARSVFFIACYIVYVGLVMAPFQRLLLAPAVALLPTRRRALMRAWLRLQAGIVLGLARVVAGVRFSVQGAIAPASCIVVMNHQSLLDIPLGVSLVPGPYPLIPTRARYQRGIIGISMLMRMMRCPFVSQGSVVTRVELAALETAAEEVARGEQSFLTFPEGHRTRDGRVLPFMTSGLRRVLGHARERPVYVVVVDGLWHLRTFRDTAFGLAGTHGRIWVRGPYTIPPDDFQLGKFMEFLRERMIETLDQARSAPAALPPDAARHGLAG